MKWFNQSLLVVSMLFVACAMNSSLLADDPQATTPVVRGLHGGALRQVDHLQVETIVSDAGIQVHLFEHSGKAIAVTKGRGVAAVRVEGRSKRYRYDLLPDEKGTLTALANFSQLAGRPMKIEVQLVDVGLTGMDRLAFDEVATVPLSELQLAASAIARQKMCPVSGKPLGSMGDPVAVEAGGQRLFVCCAGCVDAVKANPEKFTQARPKVEVVKFTDSDAALISKQAVCPVMDEPLGGMGQPIKLLVGGKPLFLCCKGCIKKVQAEPEKYLAMVYRDGEKGSKGVGENVVPAGTDAVRAGVFKVTAADAPFVAAQKKCPVMDEPLDAMGGPYKVNADGKAIYICCPGCAKKIAAEPQKYLAILETQGVEAPVIR